MRLGIIATLGLLALPVPSAAADLMMIEQMGCYWCERWDEEIAPIYPKTDEGRRAPLRRVDITELPEDIEFKGPLVFTPTFVLIHEGRELARLEGYSGDEFFWFLIAQMLDAHAQYTQVKS